MGKEHLTPAKPGDRIALKHGAYSPASFSPIARQLISDILEYRPDLGRYPQALSSWGDIEAKTILLRKHVDEHGFFTGAQPSVAVNLLLRFEEGARRARRELGLSPLAEIQLEKLKRETAVVDLALIEDLKERGRQTRNSR